MANHTPELLSPLDLYPHGTDLNLLSYTPYSTSAWLLDPSALTLTPT